MKAESASYCRLKAREHDPDAYLAALFAAEPWRQDLWALQALVAELAHVPARVSEPMLGEIRLQWWREALTGLFAGRTESHPVMEALAETITRAPLSLASLERLIDAQVLALYPGGVADDDAFARYLGGVGTDPLALSVQILAVQILDAGEDERVRTVVAAAGPVLGLARLLDHLPAQAARNQIPFSDALLAKLGPHAAAARAALAGTRAAFRALRRPALRPAFLPLSMIAPILARAESDPLTARAERALYRRQLDLLGATLFGGL